MVQINRPALGPAYLPSGLSGSLASWLLLPPACLAGRPLWLRAAGCCLRLHLAVGSSGPTLIPCAQPPPALGAPHRSPLTNEEFTFGCPQSLLQASLEQQHQQPQQRRPSHSELAPPPPDPELAGLGLAGLSNEAGEYNCFLNVIVQCLWHCSEFRAAMAAWPPSLYRADPAVAALHYLFQQLAEQQQQQAEEPLLGSRSSDSASALSSSAAANGLSSGEQAASLSQAASAPASPVSALGRPAPPSPLASPPPSPAQAANGRAASTAAVPYAAATSQAAAGKAAATAARRRVVVNPTLLREALAALPSSEFQVGQEGHTAREALLESGVGRDTLQPVHLLEQLCWPQFGDGCPLGFWSFSLNRGGAKHCCCWSCHPALHARQ